MSLPQVPLSDDAPLSEQVRYPGDWWNNFDGLGTRQLKHWYIHHLRDADRVIISDDDLDGLGSVAVLKAAYPDDEVLHVESGHGSAGLDPVEAINTVSKHAREGVDVYVTDLNFADPEADEDEASDVDAADLKQLNGSRSVHIYDHHEWDDDVVEQLEQTLDDVRIRSSDEEDVQDCATTLTFEAVVDDMKINNPDAVERMREFSRVVMDHDLWIKQDVRSDYLSSWAFLADSADEFVASVLEYGADVLSDERIAKIIREEEQERAERIRIVREELTSWHEIHGVDVAFSYGDVYHSELAEQLIEEDGADIVVVIKPWNKASMRTTEEYAIAHEFAQRWNGGGHGDAAGLTPDVVGSDGVVSYQQHWDEDGFTVKTKLLDDLFEFLGAREEVVAC